ENLHLSKLLLSGLLGFGHLLAVWLGFSDEGRKSFLDCLVDLGGRGAVGHGQFCFATFNVGDFNFSHSLLLSLRTARLLLWLLGRCHVCLVEPGVRLCPASLVVLVRLTIKCVLPFLGE